MKFKGIDLLIKDKNIKVTSIEIANILKQENFIVNRKIEQEWDYCTIIQKWRIEKTELSRIGQGETFVRALIIIKANEGYSPLEILDCIENQLMYTEIYPI